LQGYVDTENAENVCSHLPLWATTVVMWMGVGLALVWSIRNGLWNSNSSEKLLWEFWEMKLFGEMRVSICCQTLEYFCTNAAFSAARCMCWIMRQNVGGALVGGIIFHFTRCKQACFVDYWAK